MAKIPTDRAIDSTFAFRSDPYRFISRRCRELGTDVFDSRIFLRRTLCMTGPTLAQIFHDPERFQRAGAAPEPLQATLLGKGGVQTLDGEAHRHRKQMFMSLMTPASIQYLVTRAVDEMRLHAAKWEMAGLLVLYDEYLDILARAACQWAGVPIEEPAFASHVRELAALFDNAANSLAGHARTRLARKRSERWAAGLVRSTRAGRLRVPENRALHVVAFHRQLNGELLTEHVAAVELLNLLRPIVAVSVFVVLAAHAMHEHRDLMPYLRKDEHGYLERFVQEVRRFYPFFPALVAQVRVDFEWHGYSFPAGHRAMLDVYGTNHDARTWSDPEVFQPERFRTWDRSPYNFIAQGGGDHYRDHRCPGEWITIELVKAAVRFLAQEVAYYVPPQDLRIDFAHLPALPASRLVIRKADTLVAVA
jgi:fatty-acid peroxygenase